MVYTIVNQNIREVMGELSRYISKTNFQIALELGVEQLSVSTPNDLMVNINQVTYASVLPNPELGFVYTDEIEFRSSIES